MELIVEDGLHVSKRTIVIAIVLFFDHTERMQFIPERQPKRRLKNTHTECQYGHKHRSKLEASVCAQLQLRKRAGEILTIENEIKVFLTLAKIGYVVDFKCTRPDGQIFWVEAKGHPNDTWPLKKKLWAHYGPGILYIYQGHYRRPDLAETITPIPYN